MTVVKTFLALTLCLASCNGNNSSRSQSSEESIIIAKEIIRNVVYTENQSCPVDFHNGIIVESANYDYGGNVISYNYLITSFNNSTNIKIKEGILNMIKSSYIANPLSISFWDAIIETETKVIYNYYTKNGENRNIEILSSEIELFIHSK